MKRIACLEKSHSQIVKALSFFKKNLNLIKIINVVNNPINKN